MILGCYQWQGILSYPIYFSLVPSCTASQLNPEKKDKDCSVRLPPEEESSLVWIHVASALLSAKLIAWLGRKLGAGWLHMSASVHLADRRSPASRGTRWKLIYTLCHQRGSVLARLYRQVSPNHSAVQMLCCRQKSVAKTTE